MSKEGRIIEQVDAKSAIRKNAELASDWAYQEEAIVLYNLAVRFRDELIDPLERIDRSRMSDPVISFDDARNKEVLATYTVGRNALGLKDEITFNTAHYKDNEPGKKEWIYGRWSQLETLAHEQVHLYLHHLTDIDGKKRPAHGVEFVQKCESIGLHSLPVSGSHYQVADADSPFGRIMKSLGIERPEDVPRTEWTKAGGKPIKRDWWRPEKERGKSTLEKYTCPSCGLNVRIGVKEDPGIIHHKCSVEKGENVFFVKFDGNSHTIYKSK
jgi:hypothetical protein